MLMFGLLLVVSPSASLRCYTCSSTTYDRFTKESTVHEGLCTNHSTVGSIVNCNDPREFCAKLTNYIDYFDTEYTRPGCMIPSDRYRKSSVDDTLESGGNSICWIGRDVHYVATGDSACFCNTDLCNGTTRQMAASTLLLLAICSLMI